MNAASKRVFDVCGSLLGLIVLSPVLVLAALAVLTRLGRPVFYRQRRAGRDGVPFSILKFRTMTVDRDGDGKPLPDASRITALGRLFRSTSLDELPELVNVLLGDMSLIGPRPLLMEYLDRYTPAQARRHEVRPGITGWAQVHGRNALSWADRFKLDVWYVDHRSIGLDMRILWITLVRVVRREGISAEGHATMREFMGSGENCK